MSLGGCRSHVICTGTIARVSHGSGPLVSKLGWGNLAQAKDPRRIVSISAFGSSRDESEEGVLRSGSGLSKRTKYSFTSRVASHTSLSSLPYIGRFS